MSDPSPIRVVLVDDDAMVRTALSMILGGDPEITVVAQAEDGRQGLSVIAVSYYLLGLLGYVLAPVAETTGLDKTWLLAALAPLVVLVVWLGLRRVTRRIGH